MTDPTPDEVARAKRWASMQTPEVVVRHIVDYPNKWMVFDLPEWVDENDLEDGELRSVWASEDIVWKYVALALRPVFASIAPVIREECAVTVEQNAIPGHTVGSIIVHNAAAAIRALKQ